MKYDFTRAYDLIEMQEVRKWREEAEKQIENESCDFFKQDAIYEQKLKDAGVSEDLINGFRLGIINKLDYIQSLVISRIVSYCINLGKELGEEDCEYHNR